MRRLLALWLLGGALVLWLRRRRGGGRGTETVRLFFADGSSVTLEPDAAGADRLVALARGAL